MVVCGKASRIISGAEESGLCKRSAFLLAMTESEYTHTVEIYLDQITQARTDHDVELLFAMSEDLKDYIHAHGADQKGKIRYCAYPTESEKRKHLATVKERSNGQCELCGERGATQIHHLIRRGRLRVYHVPEVLVSVCNGCHAEVHG